MLELICQQIITLHFKKHFATPPCCFFQSWTGPEKLLALDELIDSCEPTQVKHMMQVIEPQFQRDFISLLPKEVGAALPVIASPPLVLIPSPLTSNSRGNPSRRILFVNGECAPPPQPPTPTASNTPLMWVPSCFAQHHSSDGANSLKWCVDDKIALLTRKLWPNTPGVDLFAMCW